MNVEEAPSRGGDRVTVGEVGSLHGSGLVPDAILLSVYKESDGLGAKECIGRSVWRDDPVCIVKLQVLEMELYHPHVQFFLRVLIRLQSEEEGGLIEVGLALVEREVDVGCLCRDHNKDQRGGFFLIRR